MRRPLASPQISAVRDRDGRFPVGVEPRSTPTASRPVTRRLVTFAGPRRSGRDPAGAQLTFSPTGHRYGSRTGARGEE
ncbi:hypothetical protein [Streptomyces sp. NPDC048438]|uniref:hypothetical protein n=1 Tax=Streptomyces sp. NPDC048438 TaxID=3365551 RepID=UPI00371C28E8